jgi:hypothetical protein
MDSRDIDEKLFSQTPALNSYINGIDAIRKTFRKFVVEGEGEPAYGRIKHIEATIWISEDGLECDNPIYAPKKEELTAIVAELKTISWPKSISAPLARVKQLIHDLGGHGTFFKFQQQQGDDFLFVQQRIYSKDGAKADLPWTFWSDGLWRMMEPDSLLPLFGLEQLSSGLPVMIHEGAKAAAHCQWLTSDDRDAKRALKDHPWGNDLKDYVHLGWPGGANRPNGVDWGPIRRSSPTLSVILVCDRDWVGEQAAVGFTSKPNDDPISPRIPAGF